MMNLFMRCGALLLIVGLLTAQAAPLTVGGLAAEVEATPSLILQIVKSAGYPASLETGSEGDDPVISITRAKGQPELSMVLLDCGSGSCKRGYLHTDYDPADLDFDLSDTDITNWNFDYNSLATVDPEPGGLITLSDDYAFTGMTRASFLIWLDQFSEEADDFGKYLNSPSGQ
jgi:hypothetical protein